MPEQLPYSDYAIGLVQEVTGSGVVPGCHWSGASLVRGVTGPGQGAHEFRGSLILLRMRTVHMQLFPFSYTVA